MHTQMYTLALRTKNNLATAADVMRELNWFASPDKHVSPLVYSLIVTSSARADPFIESDFHRLIDLAF